MEYLKAILPIKFHDHLCWSAVEPTEKEKIQKINLLFFLPENSKYSPFGNHDPELINEEILSDEDALEAFRARIGNDVKGHRVCDVGYEYHAWPSFLWKIPGMRIKQDILEFTEHCSMLVFDSFQRNTEIWPIDCFHSKTTLKQEEVAILRKYEPFQLQSDQEASQFSTMFTPSSEYIGQTRNGKAFGKGELYKRHVNGLYLHINGTFHANGSIEGTLFNYTGTPKFTGLMITEHSWTGRMFYADGLVKWNGTIVHEQPNGTGQGYLWNRDEYTDGEITSKGFFGDVRGPRGHYYGHLNLHGQRHGMGMYEDYYTFHDKPVKVRGNFNSDEFKNGTIHFLDPLQLGLYEVIAIVGTFKIDHYGPYGLSVLDFLSKKCEETAFYVRIQQSCYKIICSYATLNGGIGQLDLYKVDVEQDDAFKTEIDYDFDKLLRFDIIKSVGFVGSIIKQSIGGKYHIRKNLTNNQHYSGEGIVDMDETLKLVPDGIGITYCNSIRRYKATWNNGNPNGVMSYYDDQGRIMWEAKVLHNNLHNDLQFVDFPHREIPMISSRCTANVYNENGIHMYTAIFEDHRFDNVRGIIESMKVLHYKTDSIVECPISANVFDNEDIGIAVNDVISIQENGYISSKFKTFLSVDTFVKICHTTLKDPFRSGMPCFRFHTVKIHYTV